MCAAELEIESLSCRVRAKKHVGFPFSESSLHIVARDDAPSAIRIAHLATATGPIAIIGGPKTGLSDPAGIALDSNLNIYVANAGAPGVSVYKPLGSSAGLLNETPIATRAICFSDYSSERGRVAGASRQMLGDRAGRASP